MSSFFIVGNWMRQSGILSFYLLSRYIRELLLELETLHPGCNIGSFFINVLAYADDTVILAPSWRGLQQLLAVLYKHSTYVDIMCNNKKTVCMVFKPKLRAKIVADIFPQFSLGINLEQFVKEFKYLGYIITDNLTDDADMQRKVHNLFVRNNIFRRRFHKCSMAVKCVFFETYCICLYDAALWSTYNKGSLRKLSSYYSKCVKMFFLGLSVLTVLQKY